MPIANGHRLGPYEIVGWIGAGGMGEVYRARDSRLGREVAIKLIPARLAVDASRIRRFEQEARAAGQLNHPNVIVVYDVGTEAGAPYVVSELLDGESMRSRLGRGRVSLRTAVDYASQLAEGLAAAHDKEIVHRDVKPENVFITQDERIKILDFGIAKLTRPLDPADGCTTASTETDVGTVMGSARYMSPEQVRGEPVDGRSDLFSLGAILYEMLAARPAFARATGVETMAAVLNDEPPTLPSHVPTALARITARCLDKSPDARFQSARDLAFALKALSDSELTARLRWRFAKARTVAAAVAVLLLIVAFVYGRSGQPTPAVERLAAASIVPVMDWESTEALATISADGRFVAFLSDRDGQFDIWLWQVGTGDFKNLTPDLPALNPPGIVLRPFGFSNDGSKIWLSLSGNPGDRKMLMPLLGGKPWAFLGDGDVTPSWSPDGTRLAFVNNGNGDPMFLADATGADARRVLATQPDVLHNHDPVWSPDGRWIYFVRGREPMDAMDVWRLSSAGGTPERLTSRHIPINFLAPLDSRTLLYVSRDEDHAGPWLWALDTTTKVSRRVSWGLEQYTSVAATRNGQRIVATVARQTSTLWRVPILANPADDRAAQRYVVPTARAIAPRVKGSDLFYTSAGGRSGRLWRFSGGAAADVWRGADGTLSEPPAISPSGERLAVALNRQGKRQLTVMTTDGTNVRTVGAGFDVQGAIGQTTADWLDERWVITGGTDSEGPGLFKIPVDGGRPVRIVGGQATNPVRSPDGKLILFTGPFVGGQARLMAMRPDGTSVAIPNVTVRQGGYRFLPDGNGVVYLPGLQSRDFWLLDLVAGTRRQLTRFTDRARLETFDITADGQWIVFDRQQESSDIVLIDLPS